MRESSQLIYPSRLFGSLPLRTVETDIQKVENYRTFSPRARRIPLRFNQPVSLLVRVYSDIGRRKDWIRAGSLAQVLAGLPGDPKKAVKRLYLDEAFFTFEGGGYDFYFEFWPKKWITDYRLEVWAQLDPGRPIVVIDNASNQPLLINGQTFTLGGIAISI